MTIQFSIILPTFNDLERLQRSLQSVWRQTLPCEVVAVDDGSQREIESYVRSLGKRVVYYRHPVPLGYAQSANAGVELARGNWIVLLDSGDALHPRYLERLSQAIDRYPQAAIAACQTQGAEQAEAARVVCVPQEDIHYHMLGDRLGGCQLSPAAFRRDAFLRSGGWHLGSSHARETAEAWTRIAQYGDAVFVNLPVGDAAEAALPTSRPSGSPHLWGDLERQHQMTEQVSAKHRDWMETSPTVQMIRKFHWSWMGLKNSWFPGVDGVLPGVTIEGGMPAASPNQDAPRSSSPSFSKVLPRMASPKASSQLSRI
ncbi:MAG TPA: glycosyltransferase family 2 protein [Oscillatoriales cyanobacterium M59_W2019_021]|nr:glycosyltransferase family 2 protein [Oscillatoriales cyanobacterium M4454_W2019_049]HIK50705.1 glycosyltransferase family 2 protein [Oscillatoriales cyanobacterium M59_W2019_021]